jgi:O-antigen/teichoic acid export membrane protein
MPGDRLSLKQRILRAGGWSMGGYAISQILRLGGNLLMTRLLVPEMFGVMAIAAMVTAILNMMSDIGLQQNIVQSRRGEEPAFLDTAWVVQILRGMILWLAALAVSAGLYVGSLNGMFPPESVYASPVLPWVVGITALGAVINGFQPTGMALALRRFDQRRLVQIDLAAQAIGLAVMVIAGIATRSIWALVAGVLVTSTATTVLGHALLTQHRNSFRWDRDALRELIGFGKWVYLSSVFSVLALNGDRLILGGVVSAEVLGMYAIAVLILGAMEGALGRLFTAVSFPALSEVARTDPARLREVYYRLRVPGDVLLLFGGGALFTLGQHVIDVLYDPRYAGAGPMLQVLALSYLAARYNVSYHIYLAVGRPGYLTVINLARCLAIFALVPPLYAWGGLEAALWGIALHGLAMAPFVHGFNVRLGLNDVRREVLVLAALPAGMALGYGISVLFN